MTTLAIPRQAGAPNAERRVAVPSGYATEPDLPEPLLAAESDVAAVSTFLPKPQRTPRWAQPEGPPVAVTRAPVAADWMAPPTAVYGGATTVTPTSSDAGPAGHPTDGPGPHATSGWRGLLGLRPRRLRGGRS